MRFNPTLVLSSSALALTIGLATPAFAQENTELPACTEGQTENCKQVEEEPSVERAEAAAPETSGTITVTGTRIRRPNVESNVPITSVSAEDLTSQGDVNVGDALNDLPSLRSTFNQSNSTRFIGTTGLNVLDLRGLGVSRTLVLVNGRRHITASPGDFLVDVNTIPSDLIERVDVITGGSSAVYGSDAVAGVVNFILKRDYEGISLRGQAGASSRGDRGIQFVSLTAGHNFMDDRLNAAINLEYAHADELRFTDRPGLTGAFDGRCQFNTQEPTAGEPGGSDGIPDQGFYCGVRNAAISDGGTVTAASPVIGGVAVSCLDPRLAPGGPNAALGAIRCLNPGTPQGALRFLNFTPTGSLIEQHPAVDFRPFGSGNYIASAADLAAPGATLRDTGQLIPGLKRFTANLLLNYDASPAFQPFFEAKYVAIKSNQEGQPSFFQSTFPAFFGGGRGIRCDNPFLTAANITSLQTIGRCSTGSSTIIVVDPDDGPLDLTPSIPLGRFDVDFGPRKELVDRDTFRFVGGVRGDFNDDWNYEVAVNYGKVKVKQKELNDLHVFDFDENGNFLGEGPFLNAIDAVRDPNTGQIVCRINSTDPTQNQFAGNAPDPSCVPINVFGNGVPSAAALDYVQRVSTVKSDATEFDATAYVGGDSSQLFELPGGPIRFVLGGEFRRETAFLKADPISAAGGTFFNAFATFDPPALEVIEGFGEIEIPVLRDVQFAKELTFTAAGRVSDYNKGAGTAGTTFAWNINGTWAPVSDIRFRANYSKSVRVPTLSDLFTPAGQNFNFVNDPCDVNFINNGPNRAANCAALGVPAGFINTVARSQTIGFLDGGNPDLQEETGKSFTFGGVLTPRWVPGLSLTVDYYKITVDNLIASLTAQQILNLCVDASSINNQYCALINPRLTDNPATPENEAGLLDDPALLSSGVNFAKFVAKGIDFELAYRKNFANGHRLNFRGIATRVLERSNFTDPTDPSFEDRILSELGDPKWAANATVTYGIGRFDLRYSVNYIGKATIGTWEAQHGLNGNPPTNADLTEEVWYPDAWYHSIRLNTEVADKFNFYVGVDNLFDKKPPLGLLGTAGGDPYDTVGRYFYAGAQVEF